MPVFNEETFVREVLIVRRAADAPWAAHQVKITQVTRDGEPYNEQYLDPQPLDVAEIGDVLAPAFIDLTNERDVANAAKAAAEEALIEMANAHAQLAIDKGQLIGALADADSAIASGIVEREAQAAAFAAERQGMATTILELQGQVANLQLLVASQAAPPA